MKSRFLLLASLAACTNSGALDELAPSLDEADVLAPTITVLVGDEVAFSTDPAETVVKTSCGRRSLVTSLAAAIDGRPRVTLPKNTYVGAAGEDEFDVSILFGDDAGIARATVSYDAAEVLRVGPGMQENRVVETDGVVGSRMVWTAPDGPEQQTLRSFSTSIAPVKATEITMTVVDGLGNSATGEFALARRAAACQ